MVAPGDNAVDGSVAQQRSNADDVNRRWQRLCDGAEVALVRREHAEASLVGHSNHVNVHDVRRARRTGERTDRVRVIGEERHDLASPQETTKLRLATGATHLRNDRRSRHGNNTELEAHPMISPHGAIRPISGDQRTGVVDDRHAERGRRGLVICEATRARAAASSSSVNDPCSASHSATAARPSRINSSRRAAFVIHADTLTPSAAAASTTRSRTSGSTVIANFGDGFPLGIPKSLLPR